MSSPTLHWFRRDLRLNDNPALAAAAASGPLLCVYIHDENVAGRWSEGGASRWWLHHSLSALNRDIEDLGGTLLLASGDTIEMLQKLIDRFAVGTLSYNRVHEPLAQALEAQVADQFAGDCNIIEKQGQLLTTPANIVNGQGKPFQVFTPFFRHVLSEHEPAAPGGAPGEIIFAPADAGEKLDDWALTPRQPDWAQEFPEHWQPGESGANAALESFLQSAMTGYHSDRDRPDRRGTSRLSPHLHFGEISPARVWHATRYATAARADDVKGGEAFLRELVWREFSYYLLKHNPDMPEQPLRRQFEAFPWQRDPELLARWQRGETGYPLVDAGMRELWHTGWMHNRVRMVVASFLVKHLLIPWQDGLDWFHDTLVDADLANNSASWQWVAGCGADASPWFRIFNPVIQGEKFDPAGTYVRRWVPELESLDSRHIHSPWQMPQPPTGYPSPIVDHKTARQRALDSYETCKSLAA